MLYSATLTLNWRQSSYERETNFCRLATDKDVGSLLKYKLLTIYPFSSQNILQYDRTALHIIKMKINFVATLRYRGLSFLWLVLLMVVEHGS